MMWNMYENINIFQSNKNIIPGNPKDEKSITQTMIDKCDVLFASNNIIDISEDIDDYNYINY